MLYDIYIIFILKSSHNFTTSDQKNFSYIYLNEGAELFVLS